MNLKKALVFILLVAMIIFGMLSLKSFTKMAIIDDGYSAEKIVQEINNRRLIEGLNPVEYSEASSENAEQWARYCAENNIFGHRPLDGARAQDLITNSRCENLALKVDIPESTLIAEWMESPAHKSCFMSSSAKYVGIGIQKMANSGYATNTGTYFKQGQYYTGGTIGLSGPQQYIIVVHMVREINQKEPQEAPLEVPEEKVDLTMPTPDFTFKGDERVDYIWVLAFFGCIITLLLLNGRRKL